MNQADYFFGYFFETNIRLAEDVFFAAWAYQYHNQLKKLHEDLVVEDENGVLSNFHGMPFMDFCILTFNQRPDLISCDHN